MTCLLGIDLGTTGCRAAVYDESGNLRGESRCEYPLLALSPTIIEQDARAWWDATCRVVRGALAAAGDCGEMVRGLAVSSQGISFVPLDAAGQPLGNAISWLDTRAGAEIAAIVERFPARALFELTGKRAEPFYVLPKLLWLRSHRPELWTQARKILLAHDYLVYRLCGEGATDHSLAGGTLLHNLRSPGWCAELLAAFDVAEARLPALRWAGTPVGALLPSVADELGLRPDTVVCVGGQDQKCAALGAGIREGLATVSIGTASAISQVTVRPLLDPGMRVPTFCFVAPGRWVLEGVVGTAAGALRWYRDVLGGGRSYEELDREAAATPPGAAGVAFYPHLSGATSPHWQSTARGAFTGLSLAATRGHLARAVLESVAYQIRHNLAITESLAGRVEGVIVFGGGARSPLWRAILGDVLDRPIGWLPAAETSGLGAAMLAGVGCGLFASPDEARRALVHAPAWREPVPAAVAAYAGLYEAYCTAEAALLGRG